MCSNENDDAFELWTSKVMSHEPEMDDAATLKAETEAEATRKEGN